MSINSYKLVPVKMFEDIMKKTQPAPVQNRSITSIIENSQNDISNDQPSQKFSTPTGPQMSVGRGNESSSPMWVYDNQSILPDYSQGRKVSQSFESYKNMLDNDSIPEHIKIQLLHFFRDKYDRSRLPHDAADQIEDENQNAILDSILDPMSAEKRNKAARIIRIFLNNSNVIMWNSNGEFILPRYASINLRSLLRTLVYAHEGSDREVAGAIEIIKPFYKHIKNEIVNKKILSRLNNIQDNVRKKYVALNPSKKKMNSK